MPSLLKHKHIRSAAAERSDAARREEDQIIEIIEREGEKIIAEEIRFAGPGREQARKELIAPIKEYEKIYQELEEFEALIAEVQKDDADCAAKKKEVDDWNKKTKNDPAQKKEYDPRKDLVGKFELKQARIRKKIADLVHLYTRRGEDQETRFKDELNGLAEYAADAQKMKGLVERYGAQALFPYLEKLKLKMWDVEARIAARRYALLYPISSEELEKDDLFPLRAEDLEKVKTDLIRANISAGTLRGGDQQSAIGEVRKRVTALLLYQDGEVVKKIRADTMENLVDHDRYELFQHSLGRMGDAMGEIRRDATRKRDYDRAYAELDENVFGGEFRDKLQAQYGVNSAMYDAIVQSDSVEDIADRATWLVSDYFANPNNRAFMPNWMNAAMTVEEAVIRSEILPNLLARCNANATLKNGLFPQPRGALGRLGTVGGKKPPEKFDPYLIYKIKTQMRSVEGTGLRNIAQYAVTRDFLEGFLKVLKENEAKHGEVYDHGMDQRIKEAIEELGSRIRAYEASLAAGDGPQIGRLVLEALG